jgi:glycosyltransferase involved in cell wall biosynthesis
LKYNVLQLTGSFHQGGSERQALQLTRLLKEDGTHQIFLACLDAGGVLREEADKLNLSEIPEFRLTSFYDANFIRQIRRCVSFIRQNKIQIVQTHDFYTNFFGMMAARLAGVKARIAAKRETNEMRSAAQKMLEKQAFWLSNAIVVNAEAVREFLTKQGFDNNKIHTVYNSLDLERLNPTQSREASLAEFGLPADKKLITIVANLRHKVKNQEMFLRAAQRVRQKYTNAAFVLAGEGELTEEYKQLTTILDIEGDVYFTGRCAKVADLLAVSDICVLSSLAEGFSNSILEYMAASRPVVATRVGGAAEAIAEGESGFLVTSNDDAAMAEKILLLLENSELAGQMGKRGREIVETKFSCTAQLETTLKLYSKFDLPQMNADKRR